MVQWDETMGEKIKRNLCLNWLDQLILWKDAFFLIAWNAETLMSVHFLQFDPLLRIEQAERLVEACGTMKRVDK